MLYNYFEARLQERIDLYGRERMAADVAVLRRYNEQLTRRCSVRPAIGSSIVDRKYRPRRSNVIGYRLSKEEEECKFLAMTEPVLVSFVRTVQQERLAEEDGYLAMEDDS